MFLLRLSWLTILASMVSLMSNAALNITIDDTLGDELTGVQPVYSTNTSTWNPSSFSDPCDECKYMPQSTSRFTNQTWHEGHVHSSIDKFPGWVNVTFSGVAVYAYFARIVSGGDITHILFELDGKLEDVFYYSGAQNLTKVFSFNECLFSRTNLTDGSHTLSIILDDYGRRDNTGNVVLFDSVVYTVLESSDSSSSQSTSTDTPVEETPSNNRAIIGGAVGGTLAALFLIAAFILLYKRYRKDRQTISLLHSKVEVLESSLRTTRESQAFELPPYSPTTAGRRSSMNKD